MSGSPFKIVLVEDAESDVFLIREALEQAGLTFDLQVFDDGEKALEFMGKIESDESVPLPDVIILDLNLPRITGHQVLERVRKCARCGLIPIFILTSSDSPKDRSEIAGLGAVQYFLKSSKLDEFMRVGAVVKELLEKTERHTQASGR
jgi:DNA-binding response OmpR family regulator